MTPSDPPTRAIMMACIRIFLVLKSAEKRVNKTAEMIRAAHMGLARKDLALSMRLRRKSV